VAANGLAERVAPFKDKFVDAGLGENFIEVLQSSAAELQQTLNERAEHLSRRARATAALEAEYARGRDLVKILDAFLSSLWVKNPGKLAEWKSVSRLPTPVRKGKAAPPVVTTTPVVQDTPETPAAGGNSSPRTDVA
jgi:hypothetical protein